MDIREAFEKLKEVFLEAQFGFWWTGSEEYCKLFNMELDKALSIAAEAIRDMQSKRALTDKTLWALENELREKVLVYNLLLQAIEDNGKVNLTDEAIEAFKKDTADCVLMDYGTHVDTLIQLVTNGAKARLPLGVGKISF